MCGFRDFAKQRNGGGSREKDLCCPKNQLNIEIQKMYFPPKMVK
jgi:hypothetical protein